MNGKQARGFTLIEIVIVLAIIALMAAVSIPIYDNYSKKTKAAEAWEELTHIAALQEHIFTDLRMYDTDGSKLPAYGASFKGRYFIIQLAAGVTWQANAYVCFNGSSGCTSGVHDIAFSIHKDGAKKTSYDQGTTWTDGWKL